MLSGLLRVTVQELCYYGIFTLFYFIAGVVSAANGHRASAVVAAAVSRMLCQRHERINVKPLMRSVH